jgi:anti-sigma regulatory factor (Ser/Thr protein kinase)
VSAGFRAEAEQKGLVFSSMVVEAVVLTDPGILEAMLRNLLSNALKFTKSGGILLAARRRGSAIALEVYDTGPGVPPDEHTRIFREFERGKQLAEGEGLGLGLSIVERYARLLNMRVELRSNVGCGSRFAILVPQDLMVARLTAASSSTGAEAMEVAGKRILVLDDDQLIVAALTIDLRDRGNDARGFTTAAEADAAVVGGFIPDAAVAWGILCRRSCCPGEPNRRRCPTSSLREWPG